MIQRALLALLFALSAGAALAQATVPVVKTENVEARLVADVEAAAPGSVIHVALVQTIRSGWHTYWRNPGDSGEATGISWTLPQGWSADAIIWPRPEIFRLGPLANYGFKDTVILASALTVPADAAPGTIARVEAAATWLVCEEICIPEEGTLSLALPVAAQSRPDWDWGARIAQTIATAPRPISAEARFTPTVGAPTLSVAGPALGGAKAAHFFPYSGTLIDHAAPQGLRTGAEGLALALKDAPVAAPLDPASSVEGLLVWTDAQGTEQAGVITAQVGDPLPATSDRAVVQAAGAAAGASPSGLTAPSALLFAFLGGLILNLMPCVFPVLSLKALGFAQKAHAEAGAIRRQGLFFLAGVMATFLALAGALIGLQAAGQAIGWGFQLQSPPVVIGLAVVMFLIGLNMLGAFEVGGGFMNAGGALAAKGGDAGAFFTGALAVIVASPCTAPFMGGALAFAAVQPPAVALGVFAALGLGFAAPFVALSFAPGLLKRLPKPGLWMDRFRQALAFPMFGAAIWLAWVATVQAGPSGALAVLAAMLAAGFAVWLFRVTEGGEGFLKAAWRGVGVLGALLVFGFGANAARPVAAEAAASSAAQGALQKTAWSPETLARLRAEGKPVFVNFTAAWCVTCKVNEATTLTQASVVEAFEQAGIVYLEADWTNRNAEIAAALAEHGRNGVPLYLYYAPGAGEPEILPQVLTAGLVQQAVSTDG